MNKLTGLIRRCAEDYDMIADGDVVAVGVSGGKDSIALLCALANLRGYYPKRFELIAVTLDMGLEGMDFTPVRRLCEELEVQYSLRATDIGRIVFEERRESNPCSLCAKMRRGALNDVILSLGAGKLALAHHYDDAIETFLLSLIFEGRVNCFQPVTFLDRTGVTQIRPMLYVSERTIVSFIRDNNLPVVENVCPANGATKREEVKTLLRELGKTYPDLRSKIFGAMQRLPLEGWGTHERKRRPLP